MHFGQNHRILVILWRHELIMNCDEKGNCPMIYQLKPYNKTNLLTNHLNLGGRNQKGEAIEVTSRYLTRAGKPWIGVMGEYHFSRADKDTWYKELCKMKAGGMTIVATYLFWIYHEEIEGTFDFSGDRDIRTFVNICQQVGLDVILRIGPWAHGECRNGGFPDWLIHKPFKKRENDPEYLKKVKIWYEKIYEQVQGLFFKNGGNIIGIQLDNELVNQAEHLKKLKEIAIEIGFDVPLYTVTGWNSKYGAKIPVDEVMPVFGAYPEAPWEGHTNRLPLSHNYVFNEVRNDTAVGTDVIKETDEDGWRLPYERYPFATCELGAGQQVTHHRRPIISGMDAYILSLVKLGSGNNLVGYYMYHGGTNKIGKNSTLNETKATGYPNDYPILNYDFQTALSEYGEVREQYRLLNLLHLFVNDFGDMFAPMEYVPSALNKTFPDPNDLNTLRYCVRTDGVSGFLFVNHYQRLTKLKDVKQAVIDTGMTCFPAMDICGEIGFFFPFHFPIGSAVLEYATAQLLCRVGNTYFFATINGITPEYKWDGEEAFSIVPGYDSAYQKGEFTIVTLTWDQARFVRKLSETVYVGESCDLYEENGVLCAAEEGDFSYHVWNGTKFEEHHVHRSFHPATVSFQNLETLPFVIPLEYEAELNIGGTRKQIWKKISVTSEEGFIEIPDVCDVEQIYANEVLVADNYYYGKPWRVPAKLLYQKECYLVMSEWKDDFYREF